MDLHQRLAEFFKRLKNAPPAASAQEALDLVCRLIEEVEDEMCPLPRQDPPPPVDRSARMYPPQGDHIKRLPNGLIIARTRRHRVFCRPGGGISIVRVAARTVIVHKDGKHERAG